ncbi:hypothetical protein BCR33DRAFT_711666 [Rhizoclosmatium globosum]|uniref:Uncharacterized protein n=1 Tax=Rhizoclosmatium globosum TaxID=329046 RepID=A0A1Y2CZ83_9FUNG|nr:hypothetical protein BCR33DRAFT_711666 [Rhizoclosmatium globosum]|eukprot:ORY52338.1 hypothetical protein BCR33DRAFT_711666 [Rhizoclosmatium globosum]
MSVLISVSVIVQNIAPCAFQCVYGIVGGKTQTTICADETTYKSQLDACTTACAATSDLQLSLVQAAIDQLVAPCPAINANITVASNTTTTTTTTTTTAAVTGWASASSGPATVTVAPIVTYEPIRTLSGIYGSAAAQTTVFGAALAVAAFFL